MKKNYAHISVVLDRSGSMECLKKDTIGGFNAFLSSQKALEGEATITMVKFDNEYEIMCDMVALRDAVELSNENYIPRGGTALLDAIGRTINSVEHALNSKAEDEKPEKVIFVIITDGDENVSREFNRDQIMEMINRHREEMKWEFVFIGANQDAIRAGNSMGIRAGNSLNYAASAQGTQVMYASLTRGMNSYRSLDAEEVNDAQYAFFSEDDKKDIPKEEVEKAIDIDVKVPNQTDFLKNPNGMFQNMYVGTETVPKDMIKNTYLNQDGSITDIPEVKK